MIGLNINEAVSKRIIELCKTRNLSINGLATACMLTQSTVAHIISGASSNPKLLTIFRICSGLNITPAEFFNSDLFNDIDIEL